MPLFLHLINYSDHACAHFNFPASIFDVRHRMNNFVTLEYVQIEKFTILTLGVLFYHLEFYSDTWSSAKVLNC